MVQNYLLFRDFSKLLRKTKEVKNLEKYSSYIVFDKLCRGNPLKVEDQKFMLGKVLVWS